MDESGLQIDRVLADAEEREAVRRAMEQGGPVNPGRRWFMGAAAATGLAPLLGGCGLLRDVQTEARRSETYRAAEEAVQSLVSKGEDAMHWLHAQFHSEKQQQYVDHRPLALRPGTVFRNVNAATSTAILGTPRHKIPQDVLSYLDRLTANQTGVMTIHADRTRPGQYEVAYSGHAFIVKINDRPVQHVLVMNYHGLENQHGELSHGIFVARATDKNARELTTDFRRGLATRNPDGYVRLESMLLSKQRDLGIFSLGLMCGRVSAFQASLRANPYVELSDAPLTPGLFDAIMVDVNDRRQSSSGFKSFYPLQGRVPPNSRELARAAGFTDEGLHIVELSDVEHGNSGTDLIRHLPDGRSVVIAQIVKGGFIDNDSRKPAGTAVVRDAYSIRQIIAQSGPQLANTFDYVRGGYRAKCDTALSWAQQQIK